jgi:foldase protein PrsA
MVRPVAKPKVPVINISGSPIYAEEFEKAFLEENSQIELLRGDEYYIKVLKKEFAYKLVDEIILTELAVKSNIKVNREEILSELNHMKEGYTKESFDEMLKGEGITIAQLKGSIKKRLTLKKVLDEKVYNDIAVSDDEIADFYNQFKNNFYKPTEYKIEVITVQDEARAKEAYKRLKSKEIDFASAKEEYSILVEPLNVDEREYVPKSGLPEEFEVALLGLKPGRITGIVNTTKGFHILKLDDKKNGYIPSIDDIRDKIKRILLEKKQKMAYRNFIHDYRKEKSVIIFDDYFEAKQNEG